MVTAVLAAGPTPSRLIQTAAAGGVGRSPAPELPGTSGALGPGEYFSAVADVRTRRWDERRTDKRTRLERAASVAHGKVVANADIAALLTAVIISADVVCLEGDNQKQAEFLASALSRLDPARVSNLHMVMSCVALPDHIALFRKGIASRLDSPTQARGRAHMAQLIASGGIQVGAVHTYNELYGRYFIDLTPRVALVTAKAGDRHGNLFTGPNTEETPAIVEATAFHDGVVVAQVDELVDRVPRVDIPGDWVDLVVEAPHPAPVTPLFTRDPAALTEVHVLIAMLALVGSTSDTRWRRSTTASASTQRPSSCCCRPTASTSACAGASAAISC